MTIFVFVFMLYSENEIPFQAEVVNLNLPDGWQIEEVSAMQISQKGDVFVFHRGKHQLLQFDAQFQFIREIGAGLFQVPHGLRLDTQGNIWTTDQKSHLVLCFDPNGKLILLLGRKNVGNPGWFSRGYQVMMLKEPSDVAWDRDGNIYVADAGNFRIVKFDQNGEPITTWGEEGDRSGHFNFPHSLVVIDDRVFVSDRENMRIQVFDLDGLFLESWQGMGNPYVLELDSKQRLWVSDARRGEIHMMSLSGEVLGTFGEWGKEVGDLGFGHGLAFDVHGNLFVTEILNWRIQKVHLEIP